jgi:hypothetical protein
MENIAQDVDVMCKKTEDERLVISSRRRFFGVGGDAVKLRPNMTIKKSIRPLNFQSDLMLFGNLRLLMHINYVIIRFCQIEKYEFANINYSVHEYDTCM